MRTFEAGGHPIFTVWLRSFRNRGASRYPLKFVLSPLQHEDYLRDVALLSHSLGKEMNASNHMGVSIEISADSPGAMIAIDGTAIWLL